mmetsp:Transcript_34634/g.68341  ORF Transcript_34634/g.68341 Transcript_34634/m.68341 type:complete len:207 (+) Transcript_34634:613-1233(+)
MPSSLYRSTIFCPFLGLWMSVGLGLGTQSCMIGLGHSGPYARYAGGLSAVTAVKCMVLPFAHPGSGSALYMYRPMISGFPLCAMPQEIPEPRDLPPMMIRLGSRLYVAACVSIQALTRSRSDLQANWSSAPWTVVTDSQLTTLVPAMANFESSWAFMFAVPPFPWAYTYTGVGLSDVVERTCTCCLLGLSRRYGPYSRPSGRVALP